MGGCLRFKSLGQDELRARSQQGLQAVKSGVESLRTVLANNPVGRQHSQHQQDGIQTAVSDNTLDVSGSTAATASGWETNRPSSIATISSSNTSTSTNTTRDRSESGSWSSFLPPSLTNKRHTGGIIAASSGSDGNSGASGVGMRSMPVNRQGSIAESVTESIKSLSSGLGLGQLTGGLGLTGHMPNTSGSSGAGPYLGGRDGGQASRSRVWTWNAQDDVFAQSEMAESDTDSLRRTTTSTAIFGRPTISRNGTSSGHQLKVGAKTEEASKETAALLARIRAQQDIALERAKRMPEVEQMAQRYQDSWTEIHNHTARNSERADDADEMLQKVLEICLRHANASEQFFEESRDIKQLSQSLGEIMSMTESIQEKLVGLEDAIQKLEEDAEVMTLADWKKSQIADLDKYMESKRKELWEKAELLSIRSEQFQKEEAARKLRLYQSQFEADMAQFRRTQEEKQQELWKLAEADGEADQTSARYYADNSDTQSINTLKRDSSPAHASTSTLLATTATRDALRRLQIGDDIAKAMVTDPSSILGYQDNYEEEELREKEDLDRFLGPATESDSKEDDDAAGEDESESDLGESPSDEENEENVSEEEDEEEEETSEDELDPIAQARKARAAVIRGNNNVAGSTISAFSALAKHTSTTSLINP
ncbi:hypothetical protein FBU30_000501 [Linnemannia zychae]|nr:hypothetical protein FBU30_000501 [Linnemannia zychae]